MTDVNMFDTLLIINTSMRMKARGAREKFWLIWEKSTKTMLYMHGANVSNGTRKRIRQMREREAWSTKLMCKKPNHIIYLSETLGGMVV